MTKRILFLGSQITTGGAQRVLLDQAIWFRDQGYDVSVVFYYDKDNLLEEWRSRSGLSIQVLTPLKASANPTGLRNLFPAISRLWAILKSFQPQVIECFTHDAALIGLPVAWAAGVPLRFSAHHGQFVSLSPLKKWLHTRFVNGSFCTQLICVSDRAKNQAIEEGIHPQKITTIPNGIVPIEPDATLRATTRADLNLGENDLMILNVGRLVPEKAQQIFVAAAELVTAGGKIFRFFIAGDGPLRETLETQIRQADLSQKVVLLGNRADIPALLNAADLFVLYSETEGMPISLMEAMSVGLPVIASDLEGNRQLIPSGNEGMLIPFGSPETLAEAILSLSENKTRWHSLGQKAAEKIRTQYTIAHSCRKYEKLFFK